MNQLKEKEKIIFNYIINNPKVTAQELNHKLNIPFRSVQRYISFLKENNYIERIGSNKNGYWNVKLINNNDDLFLNEEINIKYNTSSNRTLLNVLKEECKSKQSGGIYHKIQIETTYNSNHIEGSKLSIDQTRLIFETNTIGIENNVINTNDIIETCNHFSCIDYIINTANDELTEEYIKKLHLLLKSGTSDSRKSWFNVGDYKLIQNEVGGKDTVKPQDVSKNIIKLLKEYNNKQVIFFDIVKFHHDFECIHPFQDGNGRVGRLIMFKECLKYNIVPVLITEFLKHPYYNGLSKWNEETGYLIETCRAGQDIMIKYLEKFDIEYNK